MPPRRAGAGGRSWLYVRVSGPEQERDGWSLDAQRERGVAWFRAEGLPAPEVRVEVESAGEEKLERRVELARLIRDARPGDVVAVAVLDRWSRDIVFGVQSVRALVKAGVGWVAIHEQIDATTPHGDEQLGLRMWLAETERRRIRERTVGAAGRLLAQGLWAYGTVPYGYQRGDRKQRRHLLLEKHTERAVVVVAWHERLAKGDSLRDVAAWLAEHHPDAPHQLPNLRKLTRRRIYLGEVWVRGEWMRGQHPAILTLDLWERAQRAIDGRRNVGRMPRGESTADCLLRGLLRCGVCGRRCGVDLPAGGTRWRYYRCAGRSRGGGCAGPYVPVDALDARAEEAVLERLGELREALRARPCYISGASNEAGKPEQMDPVAVRDRIERRLARAEALAVDGALDAEGLRRQRARLAEELAAVARREADQERAIRAADPQRRRDVAGALGHLRASWRGMGPERRRQVVADLVARVELDADGALRWTWRTAEELAAE